MQFVCVEIPGSITTFEGAKNVYKLLGGDFAIFDVIYNLNNQRASCNSSSDGAEVKLPVPLILPLSLDGNSTILSASLRQSVSLVVDVKKRRSGRVEYEVVGPISDNFTFGKLADFKFLTPTPVVHGKSALCNIANEGFADSLWFTGNRYVKPPLFSKPPQSVNLIMSYTVNNLSSGKLEDAEDYTSDKGINPVANYSSHAVPDFPLSAAMKLEPDSELLQMVLALFERRPIWLRQAIQEFLPAKYSNWKKKMAFARACYLFSDGPWRGALVKLGYDPRSNRESSIYQTIDFRDPYYRTIKYKTELHRGRLEDLSEVPSEEMMSRIYGEYSKDVTLPNLELHFLQPPRRPSQLYQLCDISDAKVQQLMTSESSFSLHCSRISGWYQPNVLLQIRQIMNVKSRLMRQLI